MNNSLLGILTKGSRVTSILQKDLQQIEQTYGKLDQVGVATFCDGHTKCLETQGNLQALSDFHTPAHLAITMIEQKFPNSIPLQDQPELFSNNELALVYSGQLENARDIRLSLSRLGFDFDSQRDSEVVLRQIQRYFEIGLSLSEAMRLALKELEGYFSLIVLDAKHQELAAARQGYSLTIGIAQETLYIGSNTRILNVVSSPMLQIQDGEAMILQSIC